MCVCVCCLIEKIITAIAKFTYCLTKENKKGGEMHEYDYRSLNALYYMMHDDE